MSGGIKNEDVMRKAMLLAAVGLALAACNTVAGVDGRLRVTDSDVISVQALHSQSE